MQARLGPYKLAIGSRLSLDDILGHLRPALFRDGTYERAIYLKKVGDWWRGMAVTFKERGKLQTGAIDEDGLKLSLQELPNGQRVAAVNPFIIHSTNGRVGYFEIHGALSPLRFQNRLSVALRDAEAARAAVSARAGTRRSRRVRSDSTLLLERLVRDSDAIEELLEEFDVLQSLTFCVEKTAAIGTGVGEGIRAFGAGKTKLRLDGRVTIQRGVEIGERRSIVARILDNVGDKIMNTRITGRRNNGSVETVAVAKPPLHVMILPATELAEGLLGRSDADFHHAPIFERIETDLTAFFEDL